MVGRLIRLMRRGTRTDQALFLLGIEPGIPRVRPWKELHATGAQTTWLKKIYIGFICKKKSQFLRCIYYVKDFFISYLMFIFLNLVAIFNNVLHKFLQRYICKNI